MEIVGIVNKFSVDLVYLSVSQCHDGNCKWKVFNVDKYGDLMLDGSDYCKTVNEKEFNRKSSHKGFRSIGCFRRYDA